MPDRALCLLCSLVMPAAFLCADLLPRVTFPRGDPRRTLTSFSQDGIFNYDTFLLSEDEGTLYVGARDTILSLRVDSAGSMKLTGSIVWPPVLKKKEECVFKKKSNLVRRGGDAGAGAGCIMPLEGAVSLGVSMEGMESW
uniref:Uncharacterized protein n=1 Tax=Terrapene triunguis TaxID=2587831 RepID=A0A674K5M7_9SAUR